MSTINIPFSIQKENFTLNYLTIENTVSDHILGFCVFRDPGNVKCLCVDYGHNCTTDTWHDGRSKLECLNRRR